jgi:sRNA-binding regulator protein Hfq
MSSHRSGPPQGKPPAPSGIRPPEPNQLTKSNDLLRRFEALEKLVREHFDEKNQWNTQVREWIGKKVQISFASGWTITGVLRWVDRYTLCLGGDETSIVHKGAVAVIRLHVDEHSDS